MDDETRGADSADTGGADGTDAHDTDGAGIREPRTTDAHKTPASLTTLTRPAPTPTRPTAAWALFAVDYAVRRRLSGQRLRFVRTHVLDTVVLFLPLLRRSGS